VHSLNKFNSFFKQFLFSCLKSKGLSIVVATLWINRIYPHETKRAASKKTVNPASEKRSGFTRYQVVRGSITTNPDAMKIKKRRISPIRQIRQKREILNF